jgi:glycosyltransferase involved in cell wall biosynthesis
VPLVSTAAGAPVRDGVDGLLHDVGDVDTLAGQLKELAADPARLAALRAAGLAGRDELTWARAGRRLADAYAEAGHRGPRPR